MKEKIEIDFGPKITKMTHAVINGEWFELGEDGEFTLTNNEDGSMTLS